MPSATKTQSGMNVCSRHVCVCVCICVCVCGMCMWYVYVVCVYVYVYVLCICVYVYVYSRVSASPTAGRVESRGRSEEIVRGGLEKGANPRFELGSTGGSSRPRCG